jgi:hypothetical protein
MSNDSNPNMSRASRKLRDLTDELSVEYVKSADLAGHRVNLIGAMNRVGKYGDECVFEVQYLDGTNEGCTAIVTLKSNLVRQKLVAAIQRHGVIGPVMLTEVGEEVDGNRPWGFVDASDADPAQAELLPRKPRVPLGSDNEIPF